MWPVPSDREHQQLPDQRGPENSDLRRGLVERFPRGAPTSRPYSLIDRLVTEDEIRSRVEASDLARSRTRAEVAAKIAADVERRNKIRAELAEIDAAIAAGVSEAVSVLTLAELSDFTGIPEAELLPARGTSRTGKSRRQPRRKAAAVRKSRTTEASRASKPPAAANAEVEASS